MTQVGSMTNSTTFTTNFSQLRTRKKKKLNVSQFVSIIFFFFSITLLRITIQSFFHQTVIYRKKGKEKKYLQTIKRKDEEMMERHDLLERISHSTNNDRRIDGS